MTGAPQGEESAAVKANNEDEPSTGPENLTDGLNIEPKYCAKD